MVAGFAAQREHFSDAVAAMQQAMAAVKSAKQTDSDGQIYAMYQNLAGYLRRAGLLDEADRVYRQLLEEYGDKYPQADTLFLFSTYLTATNRATQAENLLTGYLADHPNMDQRQKSNLFWNLTSNAVLMRDPKADQYRQTAQSLQPPESPPPVPPGQIRINAQLQEAELALRQKRPADAHRLTLDAIDIAPQAADGQQIALRVPLIATSLAMEAEQDMAEELYDRVFVIAQTWKASTMEPLITLARARAAFLQNRPERLPEVPAAIAQYRRVLVEANGPDSASLAEPVRMRLEFDRAHSRWLQADAAARELMEIQESLSGRTSDPYLRDLQIAARTYEAAGDYGRALPLFREAVHLSDLLATPNNPTRRSQSRMDAALALAGAGQFDEAERLGEEAVALQSDSRQLSQLQFQLTQIRQMKLAGAAAKLPD
jgi:tetratricopeptide (TPR) repeat protein